MVNTENTDRLVSILNGQSRTISSLGDCLQQIAALSTGWEYGNEGVHLLKIQGLVEPFIRASSK